MPAPTVPAACVPYVCSVVELALTVLLTLPKQLAVSLKVCHEGRRCALDDFQQHGVPKALREDFVGHNQDTSARKSYEMNLSPQLLVQRAGYDWRLPEKYSPPHTSVSVTHLVERLFPKIAAEKARIEKYRAEVPTCKCAHIPSSAHHSSTLMSYPMPPLLLLLLQLLLWLLLQLHCYHCLHVAVATTACMLLLLPLHACCYYVLTCIFVHALRLSIFRMLSSGLVPCACHVLKVNALHSKEMP